MKAFFETALKWALFFALGLAAWIFLRVMLVDDIASVFAIDHQRASDAVGLAVTLVMLVSLVRSFLRYADSIPDEPKK